MDDTWLDEANLVSYMNELLQDKLLSHGEKKTIKKVQMGKKPEEKLAKINDHL
jgi:hypothetical protein